MKDQAKILLSNPVSLNSDDNLLTWWQQINRAKESSFGYYKPCYHLADAKDVVTADLKTRNN